MTFTSDSSAAMKRIEDLSPEFRAEEMEVVDKVNEEIQEEEMDLGGQSTEESVAMDEEELEEGEIIDSDTDPGGEVTEDEGEDEEDRGYMVRPAVGLGGVRLPNFVGREHQKQGDLLGLCVLVLVNSVFVSFCSSCITWCSERGSS